MIFAQNDKIDQAKDVKKMEAAKDQKEGWSKAGGLALGLDILNFINPRVGAGDNIFRLSGAINYSANLLRGKNLWNNKFGFLIGAQKIGGNAFTKSADAIVATSQYGYQVDKMAMVRIGFG
ncbi:MAG: DUF3078 domain-containing protein [Saprospiraceae bacterium]|nr:DUF3078 domain-containing protein [Saprospiraceae bacterium]